MEPESSHASAAPLERSVSQLSAADPRSGRGLRAKSKSRARLTSQPSSSASSIAASDKSLTSFPSFPSESPRLEPPSESDGTNDETTDVTAYAKTTEPNPSDAGDRARKESDLHRPTSIVESLTSSETQKAERTALFEDSPLATRKVPGALHLATDEHIERLVSRHGAIGLVRQVAEDLAQRDVQMASLRRKADERERALRKIILECGLSNLELETKLRAVETERKAQGQSKRGGDNGGLSDMMNDAMQHHVSSSTHLMGGIDDATIRASSLSSGKEKAGKGTLRGWKDWMFGAGTCKNGYGASINSDGGSRASRPAIRGLSSVDRRPPIQEDLFTPPDTGSVRSSSRTSSVRSGHRSRNPSTSLASMALQLVAGKGTVRDTESTRGRSSSAGQQGHSTRGDSSASTQTTTSKRAGSVQAGPKSLMAMRRATPASANTSVRSQPRERWSSLGTSPPSPDAKRPDNSGPVEMDTIFAPEGQPPTLNRIYNNYQGSEYLTDRFGFIYDQRRKKRQREAAQVAQKIKRGSHTEMLTGGRTNMSPNALEENEAGHVPDAEGEDRPGSSDFLEDGSGQNRSKRWQDYLKVATFPTELLSHTPSIAANAIEVLEGTDPLKPASFTSEVRGFIPPARSTVSALNSESAPQPNEEAPSATLVKEDAEPVKLLLQQLSDVHDALQRDRTVRWNEFLRKVRAERKREGEAAAAAAEAAAAARFQRAPVMIPEAKIADGETIGVADLGVKGKVGRAKWNEFRNLVLSGIPVTNRPKIWSECSGAIFMRVPGYYDDIVSRSCEDDDPAVVSQIEMDINRTLTDNIFFRKGPGVAKLNEVLRAYARRNPEVGYCQGMNLIAANLLLIMPSTEETFWILTSIIEHILPEGYYDHSLMASRADQHVLRQYVAQVLPKLSQHLEELYIELEALTFQWFLSVFTDCLSAEALFRVWDVVLCTNDGSTFLFQVALALLKLNEQQLLQCDTPAAIYTYINHQMTNHAISIDGLIQASEGLRKVVRREDVEDKRARAIEADKRLVREREEQNEIRRTQKALTAPAVVSQASVSAAPSPSPSPLHGPGSGPGTGGTGGSVISLDDDDDDNVLASEEERLQAMTRTPTPAEEETQFGLG